MSSIVCGRGEPWYAPSGHTGSNPVPIDVKPGAYISSHEPQNNQQRQKQQSHSYLRPRAPNRSLCTRRNSSSSIIPNNIRPHPQHITRSRSWNLRSSSSSSPRTNKWIKSRRHGSGTTVCWWCCINKGLREVMISYSKISSLWLPRNEWWKRKIMGMEIGMELEFTYLQHHHASQNTPGIPHSLLKRINLTKTLLHCLHIRLIFYTS